MNLRSAPLALPASLALSFLTSHAHAQILTGHDCVQVSPFEFICTLRIDVREIDPISHPLGVFQVRADYRFFDPAGLDTFTVAPGELFTRDQSFGVGFGSGYQVPTGFDPMSQHGLVYPFRDTLTHSGDPFIGMQDLDPQNGIIHVPKPGEEYWGIADILGRADYTPAPPGSPPAIPRGNPFTGGDGFIDVYRFKVTLTDLSARLLTVTLTSRADDNRVVLADGTIATFAIADTSFTMFVPAPSSLPPILLGLLAATRRRR